MQNTKEITSQNQYLVRRVSLTDSIKSIPAGVTVTYDCREAGWKRRCCLTPCGGEELTPVDKICLTL